MRISGSCLCGSVRFAGDAEPQLQIKCYCVDCRKSSGAGHVAAFGIARKAIGLQGEVKEYCSKADSGADVRRGFCPNCGAGVYAANSSMPQIIFLRAALLDNPDLFSPQLTVYASRSPAWDPVADSIPAFPEMPPRN